jgi:hypothetical protein
MATQVTLVAGGLGVNPGPVAADATGNYIVPGTARRMVVRIANGGGSPITVTLDDPNTATPEGAAAINPDAVITVTNAQSRVIVLSGARLRRFLNATNGRISWTYSGVTTVTVEAYTVA